MKKHLTIFGKHVPIIKTKNLMQDEKAFAFFHRDKFVIEIDSSLRGNVYYLTLCHELIHAVIQRAGVSQSGISHDIEEILAEQISIAFVENFKIK